jgi:putative tryptophan/tyrosine transport system substrate-binding protein
VISRRRFVVRTAAALLAAPFVADAQLAKVHRVGLPVFGSAPVPQRATFGQALRELGWVEGQNLHIEDRCCAAGNLDRLNDFVADLVRLPADIIVGSGPQVARAARAATTTIPVVFVAVNNPVALGLVGSLAKPGGNITGVTHIAGTAIDLAAKQVQLLREIVPTASRMGVLFNPNNPVFQTVDVREVIADIQRRTGIFLQEIEVRTPSDLGAAFARVAASQLDALVVGADPITFSERRTIAELALRHRLPTIHWFREHAEVGGLIAYGTDLHYLWRRAAVQVDKILKGVNPRDIPVEQASKFELVINLKTAKALGLTITPSLRLRADQVIE